MAKAKITGTHENLVRYAEIKTSSNKTFGLVMAAFFALIGVIPLLRRGQVRWWAWAISAGFLAVSLLAPAVLGPLNRLWTLVGIVLNTIVSPIIMGALFFLVFTPMSFILRVFGKDPLNLRFETGRDSYWLRKDPPGPAPDGMPRQF